MVTTAKMGGRCGAWPEHEVLAINAAVIAGKPEDKIRRLVAMRILQRTENNREFVYCRLIMSKGIQLAMG